MGAPGVRLFTNPCVFEDKNIHQLWGLWGVHSGQTLQRAFFSCRKGSHVCIHKGVETYWKNSTPPEEDEGRSGHLKSFTTQIDIRSKYR